MLLLLGLLSQQVCDENPSNQKSCPTSNPSDNAFPSIITNTSTSTSTDTNVTNQNQTSSNTTNSSNHMKNTIQCHSIAKRVMDQLMHSSPTSFENINDDREVRPNHPRSSRGLSSDETRDGT